MNLLVKPLCLSLLAVSLMPGAVSFPWKTRARTTEINQPRRVEYHGSTVWTASGQLHFPLPDNPVSSRNKPLPRKKAVVHR